ncbi:MAG: hypothetical protein KKF39_01985 [Nanoarchaeota archaeon]|nr:hypothetical protein [Nanoarchaeota archaeon]
MPKKKDCKTQYPRYFCVPANLKSLLKKEKHEIGLYEIGNYLGVKVPKKFVKDYPRTEISEKNKFEINIHKKEYLINSFFKKKKIPLKLNYFYITITKKVKSLLNKKFKTTHVMICYDYPTLFNKQGHWGHVSLISKFNQKGIWLFEPKDGKESFFDYDKISSSIKSHGKRKKGGFWVISKK